MQRDPARHGKQQDLHAGHRNRYLYKYFCRHSFRSCLSVGNYGGCPGHRTVTAFLLHLRPCIPAAARGKEIPMPSQLYKRGAEGTDEARTSLRSSIRNYVLWQHYPAGNYEYPWRSGRHSHHLRIPPRLPRYAACRQYGLGCFHLHGAEYGRQTV